MSYENRQDRTFLPVSDLMIAVPLFLFLLRVGEIEDHHGKDGGNVGDALEELLFERRILQHLGKGGCEAEECG